MNKILFKTKAMGNNDSENFYDNSVLSKKDAEKLKQLKITSPPVSMKDAIRVGNCLFFPKNEKRREEIIKKYSL